MAGKRKNQEPTVENRKIRFAREQSSDEESVSTVNESEEDCQFSLGSDEVGAPATCSTCNLSMKTQFLEDLKREQTGKCEDIFKKSFFERLDRKGIIITVNGGNDGLLLYRESVCWTEDFMLNLINNSAMLTQKAANFLLKQLHEKNVVQRGIQQ